MVDIGSDKGLMIINVIHGILDILSLIRYYVYDLTYYKLLNMKQRPNLSRLTDSQLEEYIRDILIYSRAELITMDREDLEQTLFAHQVSIEELSSYFFNI